jgi:uncharacterized protein (DUF983 family)
MEKEKKRKKCKNCGSGQVYVRVKKNELVCRACGNIEKLESE